jgi:DnaJ-class molecular chaperone
MDMKQIMILCHTCEGCGFVEETEFTMREPVKCICPECRGSGFIFTLPFKRD